MDSKPDDRLFHQHPRFNTQSLPADSVRVAGLWKKRHGQLTSVDRAPRPATLRVRRKNCQTGRFVILLFNT